MILHKPSARRGYLFDDVTPLFAFSYGLSYTAFRLDYLRLGVRVGTSSRDAGLQTVTLRVTA